MIIEGEAKSPVYLYIHNEKGRDPRRLRRLGAGHSPFRRGPRQETTPEASFGVIGQAGENLVPMSNMMVDKSHPPAVSAP